MDIMDGLAGTLAGMQEDAMKVAQMGGGVLLGATLAHIVTTFADTYGLEVVVGADGKPTLDSKGNKQYTYKDASGASLAYPPTYEEQDKVRKIPHWLAPVATITLGLGLFAMGKDSYPVMAGANGLGMVAYGAGRLAKNFLNRAAEKDPTSTAAQFNKYIPFAAVDTYESPLLAGLGAGPGSIERYLNMNGLGYGGDYSRSSGAPVMVEQINGLGSGAPTQFQEVRQLNAAPMTISGLHGLSATLM